MKTLAPNFLTGIKELDELTAIIHDEATPKSLVKHIEELRDEKMMKYESSCHFHKYYQYQFEKENFGQPPVIKMGVEVFQIQDGYTLELGTWEHVCFKDKVNDFIYVKGPDGRIYFPETFHDKDLLNEDKTDFKFDVEGRMHLQEMLVTKTVWCLYQLSFCTTNNRPKRLFDLIVAGKDKKKSYDHTTEGMHYIYGNWRGNKDLKF